LKRYTGWTYILKCSDESFYTGSTKNLVSRIIDHQRGQGANHTRYRLPVTLVYLERFERVQEAFYREKQIQGWSRKKKQALISGMTKELKNLARCLNESSHLNFKRNT
jgi:putative endonuclease